MKKRGFSPVLDENTEIMVLGSLPSDESILKQQYYANPGNDFWKLLGWKVPRGEPAIVNRREGVAFWQLLDQAGLDIRDTTGVIVARGPGSFNGLRVGISTAKGLRPPATLL